MDSVLVISGLTMRIDNIGNFPLVLVFHHFAEGVESLFDRLTAFGAAFQVRNVVLLGKVLSLLRADLSLALQIHLVPDEHHLSGLWGGLGEVFNPVSFRIKQKSYSHCKRTLCYRY